MHCFILSLSYSLLFSVCTTSLSLSSLTHKHLSLLLTLLLSSLVWLSPHTTLYVLTHTLLINLFLLIAPLSSYGSLYISCLDFVFWTLGYTALLYFFTLLLSHSRHTLHFRLSRSHTALIWGGTLPHTHTTVLSLWCLQLSHTLHASLSCLFSVYTTTRLSLWPLSLQHDFACTIHAFAYSFSLSLLWYMGCCLDHRTPLSHLSYSPLQHFTFPTCTYISRRVPLHLPFPAFTHGTLLFTIHATFGRSLYHTCLYIHTHTPSLLLPAIHGNTLHLSTAVSVLHTAHATASWIYLRHCLRLRAAHAPPYHTGSTTRWKGGDFADLPRCVSFALPSLPSRCCCRLLRTSAPLLSLCCVAPHAPGFFCAVIFSRISRRSLSRSSFSRAATPADSLAAPPLFLTRHHTHHLHVPRVAPHHLPQHTAPAAYHSLTGCTTGRDISHACCGPPLLRCWRLLLSLVATSFTYIRFSLPLFSLRSSLPLHSAYDISLHWISLKSVPYGTLSHGWCMDLP